MPRHDPVPAPSAAIAPAFAWARYRRIMTWMGVAALASGIAALVWLQLAGGGVRSIHMTVAVLVGVGGSVLMTGALMGLVFLSSGTGHDDRTGSAG